MKRTVLTFGIISGLILAVMMIATVPFLHKVSGDKGLIIGYTTIFRGIPELLTLFTVYNGAALILKGIVAAITG